jgi:lipopolysaccharide heptosyltransferase II
LSGNISKSEIDWSNIRRVLVVRLRSIGDTVLATSSLIALRRFLPDAQIDVLLEDWVAPVLEGFDAVDNVLTVSRGNKKSRIETAWSIRCNRYDVAINLHGGTTATFFVRASGAKYRVGFANYRYKSFYTHPAPSPLEFWQTTHAHSAEQQLALLGFVGVPVADKTKSRLAVTESALASIENKLTESEIRNPKSEIALIHPTAAFDTKQWASENFARVAEFLFEKNLRVVAVATNTERAVLENLRQTANVPISIFDDLTLPEITALASKARIFIGNDSGIAHIAAAVNTPSVVIFGASNPNHWRPWTNAPNEIVRYETQCEHELGEIRKGSENPTCIRCVTVEAVGEAIERVLKE